MRQFIPTTYTLVEGSYRYSVTTHKANLIVSRNHFDQIAALGDILTLDGWVSKFTTSATSVTFNSLQEVSQAIDLANDVPLQEVSQIVDLVNIIDPSL